MKTFSRKRLGFGLVLLIGVGLILTLTQCSPSPTPLTNTVPKVQPFTIADLVEDMVSIPAGTFVMGSPPNEILQHGENGPRRTVTISKRFWMSKYEVTQGQYKELMGNNPSGFRGAGLDAPVESVSWDNAVEFCRQLTNRERAAERLPEGHEYRLPTEAQWEYACRAGTTTRFSYGADTEYSHLRNYAWFEDTSRDKTHLVGGKLANPWGLYDMTGNVYEWCWDWHSGSYYSSSPDTDPVGNNSGSKRVVRGGGWNSYAWNCRAAFRNDFGPGITRNNVGFRSVLPTGQP